MTAPQCNLVLVHTQPFQARSDLESIKARMADRAPDIEVFIVDNSQSQSVTRRQAARRPSLVFSSVPLERFRPMRGKVYAAKHLTKWEEYGRLMSAGLPIPEAVMLEPDTRLDPETWGPFTVLKPNVGFQAAGVSLVRTRDVRWRDPFSWPPDDPRYGSQMLAQKFVDTGPLPVSYRVLTVFARVVYSTVFTVGDAAVFDRNPAGTAALNAHIAATSGDRRIALNHEEDVLDLARRAAEAVSDVASLAIDVIRDAATGELYLLEFNSRGRSWHFSSVYGRQQQKKYGLDYAAQFGALDVIADALIDVTRREAE